MVRTSASVNIGFSGLLENKHIDRRKQKSIIVYYCYYN
jgi:hypothetical protein